MGIFPGLKKMSNFLASFGDGNGLLISDKLDSGDGEFQKSQAFGCFEASMEESIKLTTHEEQTSVEERRTREGGKRRG